MNFERPMQEQKDVGVKEPKSVISREDAERINTIGELDARLKAERLPKVEKLLKLVRPGDVEIISKYDAQRQKLLEKGIPDALMTQEEKQEYYNAISRKDNFINFLLTQYEIKEDASEEIYQELIALSKKRSVETNSVKETTHAIQEGKNEDQKQLAEIRKKLGIKAEVDRKNVDDITKEILAEAEAIQIQPIDKNEKGQLLSFPGGPVSNLSEKQWKVVRTEKFKAWFGNWENPPVKSFKTAKGSIYTYDAEGKTSRFKTATGEQFEKQDITVFVKLSPRENQDYLNAYLGDPDQKLKIYVLEQQTDGSFKKLRDISQINNPDKVCLAILKNNEITQIKRVSLYPRKEWQPFDTRQFKKEGETFTEQHLGNKIVNIECDVSGLSKVLDNNGEPLVLDNNNGTASFVRMQNPFDTDVEYVRNWMKQNKLSDNPERFNKFMNYLKSQGYDGLMIDGRTTRDLVTGKYGHDESQILRIGK